jgi:2-polyprenyl-3-methyl-5-hydroxy-6-metoxy-1,4-benzoquinol methylase
LIGDAPDKYITMYTSGSKRSWDNYVNSEPLFAAVSDPKFSRAQLTPDSEKEFFKLGEDHICKIIDQIRTHFDPNFRPRTALDFGCGPGRLVVPLTRVADRVTGVDRNPNMIRVAREYSRQYGAYEADFVLSDELEKGLPEKYNFIHSVLVFQHIPVKEGQRLLKVLLSHLEPGGIGAFDFTLHRKAPLWRKMINRARIFGPVNCCVNLIQGKRANHPFAQMNSYNLTKLLQILHSHGSGNCFLCNSTDGEYFSSTILFRAGNNSVSPPA